MCTAGEPLVPRTCPFGDGLPVAGLGPKVHKSGIGILLTAMDWYPFGSFWIGILFTAFISSAFHTLGKILVLDDLSLEIGMDCIPFIQELKQGREDVSKGVYAQIPRDLTTAKKSPPPDRCERTIFPQDRCIRAFPA